MTEERSHDATMISPRAVDSQGTIFFNQQNREDGNEYSDDELPKDGSASPLSLNGIAQPRIDRRTNSGSKGSSGQEEQKQSEILEIYKVLLGVMESLRDIREDLRDIKRAGITERTNRSSSTHCVSSAPRNTQADCTEPTRISGSYFNNNNRLSFPEFDYEEVAQRRTNLPKSTPNNQPLRSRFPYLSQIEIPPFTGKEDWGVWIARFEALACRFGLSSEDKLDLLLPRLEGQAAQFVYSYLPIETLTNYGVLIREISSRFRVIETPRSFAAKFSKRSQRIGETAEEFAADLQALYFKAHGFRDQKTRNEDLVRRFLDGLRDDDIRFEVEYHKDPQTIDEAVFHVVNFIQTRNHTDRDRRSHSVNLRVAREETCTKSTALSAPSCDRSCCMKDVQTDEMAHIATDGVDNTRIVKQLIGKVDLLEKEIQNEGTVRRQYVHVQCFTCNKIGHYARDCPNAQGYHGNWTNREVGNGNTLENSKPDVTGPAPYVKHVGLPTTAASTIGSINTQIQNPISRVHGGTLTVQRLKPSGQQLPVQPVSSAAQLSIGRRRLQADRHHRDQRKRSIQKLVDKGLVKTSNKGKRAHKADHGNVVQQQVTAQLMYQS